MVLTIIVIDCYPCTVLIFPGYIGCIGCIVWFISANRNYGAHYQGKNPLSIHDVSSCCKSTVMKKVIFLIALYTIRRRRDRHFYRVISISKDTENKQKYCKMVFSKWAYTSEFKFTNVLFLSLLFEYL
jgi:hypothetical protein